MALKLIRRLSLLGQAGALWPVITTKCVPTLASSGGTGAPQCAACLWTSAGRCVLRRGCQKLRVSPLSTVVGETPLTITTSCNDSSFPSLRLSQPHRPTDSEERAFGERLGGCSSSRQVLRLLRSVEMLSDVMAAAALHRVADLEHGDEHGLRDPGVLDTPTLRALCLQLERETERLTDDGLVSALAACTRLYLDPRRPLVAGLVAESKRRLEGGRLSVGQLCVLGQAMLALEGPGCGTLGRAMEQIEAWEPAWWSPEELQAAYALLRDGAGEDGRRQALLNAMHGRAAELAPTLPPAAVSELLVALATLGQTGAMPPALGLCRRAARLMPHFTDEELAAALEALARLALGDRHLLAAVERRLVATAFTARPETVTAATQYLAGRRVLSRPAMDAVAESLVYRADSYNTGQVARQVAAMGRLGYLPPDAPAVFGAVEAVLNARFAQFQPRTLLSLLHACALLGRFPGNFVSRVFGGFFLQQLQEDGTVLDRVVLAQLTQLYMTMKLEYPFYEGPRLHSKYRVKSFLMPGHSLETPVDEHLYIQVKTGLVDLLGARSFFASRVLTPYCYTLDVEIKLDEEGYVLPASHTEEVYRRIALCVDGQKRFTSNTRQLLGTEVIKQRHLRLLGYEVVQIPFYEFEQLETKRDVVEHLHKKVFPHSYRLSW